MSTKEIVRKDIPIALSGEYMTQLTNASGGGRKYEVNGTQYDSVTTLINNTLRNFGVERWKDGWISDQLAHFDGRKLTSSLATEIVTASAREMEESASIGTHMHSIIEALLRNEELEDQVTDQLAPAVKAWLKWRRQFIEWQLVGTEVGVYGNGYAGQVDALFKQGDSYMVVDWKTSSGLYDSSFLQVAAYAHALKEMYALHSVKACVVRLVNDYPRIKCTDPEHIAQKKHDDKCKHGKKNRRVPKVFSDECEYVCIDVPSWYDTFSHMVATSSGVKQKVQKVRI